MSPTITSDFRREGFQPLRIKGSTLDFRKIIGLPEDEFAERYLGEMTRYFYEHAEQMLSKERERRKRGITEGLEPIPCTDCHHPIESPQDLRRYYGNSIHAACFLKRWKEDRPTRSETDIAYWDRIAKLSDS
ncbi:MAG: hypothetical protein KJ600_05810 [Nanoarchaeota archaeon]|nr:hypothetical protein [Nanoarchaeota archaeon]MBU1104045.1 hypothetical protein [Nanoarchaeota archaeon]